MKCIKRNILLAGLLTVAIAASAQTLSFNNCPTEDITLCEPDPRIQLPDNNKMFLGEINPEASSCSAHIRFQESVSSSCGIIVTFFVDYYPFDGAQRIRIQDTSEAFVDASDVAQITLDTKLYGTPGVLLDGLPYNEDCPDDPGGYHRLVWTIINECGDVDSCSYRVRLEDCVAPLVVPVGASTVIFPLEQEVSISAQDFVESAIDDCSPVNWLLYSWKKDIFTPIKTLNCDSIAANGGPAFQFDVWVADGGVDRDCNGTISWAERAKSNVFTLVLVDDDCGGELYDGEILSENRLPVSDVLVSLHGVTPIITAETNFLGRYRLPELDTTINYTVIPTKTTGVPDGISTLDLIKIQKHLLGIEQLDSPYKMIAADANNNSDISAVDLLELRKIILRVTSTLPNNTSWRFVPESYVFPDSTNPWPFPSVSTIDELNFVGIKVGDVNESITEPKINPVPVILSVDDRFVQAGQTAEVKVRSSRHDLINGIQGTIELRDASLTDVLPGDIGIDMEDFAVHKAAATFSWLQAWPSGSYPGEVLFTLVVTPEKDGMISEMIGFSSSITEAEIYLKDSDVEAYPIEVEFDRSGRKLDLVMHGSNPIGENTLVTLESPVDGDATIWILDFDGKVNLKKQVEIQDGQAVIPLTSHCEKIERGAYVLAAEQNGEFVSLVFLKTRF